ncbi:MAG: penicillin-binding protein 2 [Gammaproteobacteria bacterium]
MRGLPTLKNVDRERRLFQRRMLIACALMVLCAAGILARLAWLQVIHHERYSTLSHDNRVKIVPLPPPRGLIYSRDGVVLADNRASFALTVVPENAGDIGAAMQALGTLLEISEEESEQFARQLRLSRRFEAITVKTNLSPEEVAIFSVNRFRFPGFSIEAGLSRHYALGESMAHVVGYVGRVSEADLETIDHSNYSATTHMGKIGVEKAREDLLHGKVGYQSVEVNAQGRVLRIVERTPPRPGADLYLTVDSALQAAAIEAMAGRTGAVVVLEPPTGAILAFVSNPSFDPNAFVNGISRALYGEWSSSPERPLYNRALKGQYPPGSTIKPLVALAGLEYGVRTPDAHTWCPGFYQLPGQSHRYRDWLRGGHGHVDMKRSIAHSCDVYYYDLARDLGIRRLHEMLARFGLGAITGVDVPGENAGLLPSPEWKRRARNLPWYPGETLIAGIGQGFMLTTPLQLAHAAGIVGMRGEVAIPHFLEQFEGGESAGEVMPSGIYRRPSVALSNPAHWDTAVEGMVAVVHGPTGTARRSGAGAPVEFAGKTGTAQVFGVAQNVDVKDQIVPEHLKDHALFIAFAPVDEPQIALAVVVEHGGGGSSTAAPIARQLIDHVFGPAETPVPEAASGRDTIMDTPPGPAATAVTAPAPAQSPSADD